MHLFRKHCRQTNILKSLSGKTNQSKSSLENAKKTFKASRTTQKKSKPAKAKIFDL